MRGIIGFRWRRFKLPFFRSSSCPAQHFFDPLQHDKPTIDRNCLPSGAAAMMSSLIFRHAFS